jgi:membrane fusion protein, multidrug efflux system
MERILAQNLLVRGEDRGRLCRLIIPYIIWESHPRHLTALRGARASGRLPVIATVTDETQNPITGTLSFMENQVDAATGSILLKATFANHDTRLWPGQFVNVTLRIGTQANAIAAPSVGIQIGQNGPYVFLIKDDSTVELRLVRVARTVGNKTIIAEGLGPGDRIVVDGQLRLSNGTRVNVQRGDPLAPKAPSASLAERSP